MQKNKLQSYLQSSYENIKKQRNYLNMLSGAQDIEVEGFSDFFFDTQTEILFHYGRQVINLKNHKVYLSLFEKTTNFSMLPKHSKLNLYSSGLSINGDFSVKEQVKCEMFIMFYDDSQMIDSLKIVCSNKKLEEWIESPKNATSYRIALKIEGSGYFQINSLNINQKIDSIIHANVTSENGEKKEFDKVDSFRQRVNALKYYRKIKPNSLKVASILDEFSEECFKYDCDLLPLSKETWQSDLEDFKPDFLLVESAWQGNKGSWTYEVANLHINKHRTQLKELTQYCRKNKIKTVFWDKEGVENFDFFKEAAKYFDYIFTADENNIPNFKEYAKNDNVFELPFATQPQIHNPIYKNRNYLGKIAFAGSYYNNKHDLRKKDINALIKPAINYNVEIFDRFYGKDPTQFPNNQWPDEFKNNIIGSLDYSYMVEAYKNYDIFLNVNSVQNSKNMFARRVFEVLSSKTMVISGPSKGVESIFEGIVPVGKTKEDADTLLRVYSNNPALREKMEKEGARLVLKHHTYKNRLQTICNRIGIKIDLVSLPKVTIITSTQRSEFMDSLYANIKHQTYENIEVVIVLNKNSMNQSEWEKKFRDLGCKVTIIKVDEQKSLGHCLNEAINHSSGEVISKFDDDDYYAPNYLTDMMISMDYSNADIVGKSAHYLYFEESNLLVSKKVGDGEETYSDFIAGATLVFTREVYNQIGGFSDKSRGEDSDFLKRAKEKGLLIYSGDAKNYCCIRRVNKDNHTWKVDDMTLLRTSNSRLFTKDYITPITI